MPTYFIVLIYFLAVYVRLSKPLISSFFQMGYMVYKVGVPLPMN